MECQFHKGYTLPVVKWNEQRCPKCHSLTAPPTPCVVQCKICGRRYDVETGAEITEEQ